MRLPNLIALIAIGVGLSCGRVLAQTARDAALVTATNHTSVTTNSEPEETWSFSASALAYIVPDSREFVQPTFTADRGWLHLEARYNYESLDTGSAWIGGNFSFGEKLSLELTPMLGGVFGDVTGLAPGYKYTLGWRKLELYSEGEYMFDTGDSSANFFYTWTELTLAPVDWFRFGLVVQRTKLYETDFDIQRGFLIGFSCKRVDFTTYVFNPDASRPTVVLGVGLSF